MARRAPPAKNRSFARRCRAGWGRSEPSGLSSCAPLLGRVLPVHEHFQRNPLSSYVLRKTVRQKRTWITGCHHSPFYEYTPFCNGPGDVKSPRVIVTPPSSRFCPWSAPRPPHYAVRRNGEPI